MENECLLCDNAVVMRTNKILSTAWLCIYSPPLFVYGETKSNKDKYVKSLQRGLKTVGSPQEGSDDLTGVVLPLRFTLTGYWKRGVWQKQFPAKVVLVSCDMTLMSLFTYPLGTILWLCKMCRQSKQISHTSIWVTQPFVAADWEVVVNYKVTVYLDATLFVLIITLVECQILVTSSSN